MACSFSFSLSIVSVVILTVTCAPLISGYEYDPPTSVEISFMKRYGYLQAPASGQNDEFEHAQTPDTVTVALKRFQAFVGVPQTGNLDTETKKWITKKRCGVKDIYDDGARRRRRADTPRGWTKRTITYRVVNGSSNNPWMTKARIEEMVSAAFDVWAPYSGLTFVRKERGEADIMITFVTGNHGDGNPFDGPGVQLAHTFDPPIGDIHFDDEERWVRAAEMDEDDEGTDFEATVLHEIGHALGMRHTTVQEAVMFPYYREESLSLSNHDILELRKIYSWSNPTPLSKAAAPPSLCEADYDTIQVIQGKIFTFKDDWVWLFTRMRVLEQGYPRKVHDMFMGLPTHVTLVKAVYEKMNGNIAIFAGRLFWEFSPSLSLQRRGELSEYSIPRYIPELTTVFRSNFNNRTYLINTDRFWRYDEETGEMDAGYPKSMDRWRKIPYPVTAAVVWDEDTYFFKGPRFWNFDNRLVQARTTLYPQPVAPVWFTCNYTSNMADYLRYGDDEINFN